MEVIGGLVDPVPHLENDLAVVVRRFHQEDRDTEVPTPRVAAEDVAEVEDIWTVANFRTWVVAVHDPGRRVAVVVRGRILVQDREVERILAMPSVLAELFRLLESKLGP